MLNFPANIRRHLGVDSLREAEFLNRIRLAGLPEPVTQYRITSERKYRWDFAWPTYRLCVELHGGIYKGGAHNRAWGVKRDADKLNTAAKCGWIQLVFTPEDIEDGLAVVAVGDALWANGWTDRLHQHIT